jgi:shikimate kinase
MANIVLAGFMGTGKSAVGRFLSRSLGLEFLDLDELIEKEAGASIPEIFSGPGEARFREMEAGAIERLASGEYGDGLVVATGGGAVVNPRSRKALKSWGVLVCLTASVDEIMRRTGCRDNRPLLAGENRREAAKRLIRERAEAYRDCDLTVDTTSMSIEQVAGVIKDYIEARSGQKAA